MRPLQLARLTERLERLEAQRASVVNADPSVWDWFGDSCPCGLENGLCRVHPRARENQRPPDDEWNKFLLMAGRGFGKTRSGSEFVRQIAETKQGHRIALVAPTAADVRDVMVEGDSGILTVSPPWFRPIYEPSKRRLTWPNGVIATTYSAEDPDSLRGPQHTHAWCDEPGAWRNGGKQAWDMLMFGLRLGANPQVFVTGTPKPTKLIKALLADPRVQVKHGTTYENRPNLAPSYFSEIITTLEGTRLGEQELNAQLIDVMDGVWFGTFSVARHVSDAADYQSGFRVLVAIDAGTSRWTGAIFFQLLPHRSGWSKVHVIGDYLGIDTVSLDNAQAILAKCKQLSLGPPDVVRIDPAASARTSIGAAAMNEYKRVFGERTIAHWPRHLVHDGLDQIEIMLGSPQSEPRLLIHPRCRHLIEAFQNYRRQERGGEFLDAPVDPQNPHEDLMDALRGGIRDAFPEGRVIPPNFRNVHARSLN